MSGTKDKSTSRGSPATIQKNEMEALEAIYMDDFQIIQHASDTGSSPIYTVQLKAQEYDPQLDNISLELTVAYSPRYPYSPPDIKVSKRKNLNGPQLKSISDVIQEKIQESLGSEMIYEICEAVKEHIVLIDRKKVTFYDKMVQRKEQTEKAEEEKKLGEALKASQLLEAEKQKEMAQIEKKIKEELQIKEEFIKQEKLKSAGRHFPEEAHDELMSDEVARGTSLSFAAPASPLLAMAGTSLKDIKLIQPILIKNVFFANFVSLTHCLSTEASGAMHLGGSSIFCWSGFGSRQSDSLESITHSSPGNAPVHVKEIVIRNKHYSSPQGLKKLLSVVDEINRTAALSHESLLPVYGSHLEREGVVSDHPAPMSLYLFQDARDMLSLENLLLKCGSIQLSVCRYYMTQLLKVTQYLHDSGFILKNMGPASVYVSGGGVTQSTMLVSNVGFERKLFDLQKDKLFSSDEPIQLTDPEWMPPEVLKRPAVFGRKADIWSLGVLLIQMIFGSRILIEKPWNSFYGELWNVLPKPCAQFLQKIFDKDPASRPAAYELLEEPFIKDDVPFAYQLPLLSLSSSSVAAAAAVALAKPPRDVFSDAKHGQPTNSFSRYYTDFEELEFLGKGGFGEVVKVRNKIDNRFYAVKRIKLDPDNTEMNKKILREVVAISRLHHEYIVRYYQAWLETSADQIQSLSPDQGSESSQSDESTVASTSTDSETESISDSSASVTESSSASEEELSDTDETGAEWFTFGANRASQSVEFRPLEETGMEEEIEFVSDDVTAIEPPLVASEAEMPSTDPTTSEASPPKKRPAKKGKVPIQYLYIQMEYCANKTLRDVIDEGIESEAEAWRLFRQIVEGLVHIHSQGMIHRDLKPSNIFLDANGDVKIGDFGLAAIDATSRLLPSETGATTSNKSAGNDSFTGGIGTPVYVSPELDRAAGARYNQKVDMYSLGIIFFEMLCPMETGMERAVILRDLRKKEIMFPDKWQKDKLVNQTEMLKLLLNHQPKERPSSLEVLKSEWLPPKMEDEYIQEAIRTVAKPSTPYYHKLMGALFKQPTDEHKEYTFDFNSGTAYDRVSLYHLQRLKESLSKVFRRHGATEIFTPAMIPHSSLSLGGFGQSAATLLDTQGQIVYLPSDAFLPFARYICRNGINDLRRYCFDRVYRANPAGGQPRQAFDCNFDFVHSSSPGSLLEEAEVIRVAFEALEETSKSRDGTWMLRINHTLMVDCILKYCRISLDLKAVLVNFIYPRVNPSSWTKFRNFFTTEHPIPLKTLEGLRPFLALQGEPSLVFSKMKALLKSTAATVVSGDLVHLQTIETYLSSLVSLLKEIGCPYKILFVPMLSHHSTYFEGLVFDIVKEDHAAFDIFAAGGRYDRLLEKLRLPTSVPSQQHAVGVSFSISRFATLLPDESLSVAVPVKCNVSRVHADVCVAIFGQAHYSSCLKVVSEMWSASFRTVWHFFDEDALVEDALAYCRKRLIPWVVYIKEHHGKAVKNAIFIKLRHSDKKFELELSLRDVATVLSSQLPMFEQSLLSHGKADLYSSVSSLDYYSGSSGLGAAAGSGSGLGSSLGPSSSGVTGDMGSSSLGGSSFMSQAQMSGSTGFPGAGTGVSSQPPNISVSTLQKERSKYLQRSITDRASKSLTSVLAQLAAARNPVELLVYDFPIELNNELWLKEWYHEDAFRSVSNKWADYDDSLGKWKTYMNNLRSRKITFVFCFHIRTETLSFHCLPK